MILCARPLPAPPGHLKFWVGAFALAAPPNPLPAPTFNVGGKGIQPVGAPQWFPVRDNERGPGGTALNRYGVFLLDLTQSFTAQELRKVQRVEVALDGLRANANCRPLPAALPDEGFTLLLASCFYWESDSGGLTQLDHALTNKPDLVILAGDQVYLDNPFFEDVPSTEPALSKLFGAKYARNFLCTDTNKDTGLQPLLKMAPTACIPDDHELWNNYPTPSITMKDSFSPTHFKMLRTAARALYEDYQHGVPGMLGAQRIDVGPLHILLTDMRFDRNSTDAPLGLFSATTANDLAKWEQDLRNAHLNGELAIGVLACGQVLFDKAPGAIGQLLDDNLQNYAQFGIVQRILRGLAKAGIPVLYLSGDVHYSRVTAATLQATGHECLFEVVCSPSSLVDPPVPPRPDAGPTKFDRNQFTTRNLAMFNGNTVSTLGFRRMGSGVHVTVDYYSLSSGQARKRLDASCSFDLVPRF